MKKQIYKISSLIIVIFFLLVVSVANAEDASEGINSIQAPNSVQGKDASAFGGGGGRVEKEDRDKSFDKSKAETKGSEDMVKSGPIWTDK